MLNPLRDNVAELIQCCPQGVYCFSSLTHKAPIQNRCALLCLAFAFNKAHLGSLSRHHVRMRTTSP